MRLSRRGHQSNGVVERVDNRETIAVVKRREYVPSVVRRDQFVRVRRQGDPTEQFAATGVDDHHFARAQVGDKKPASRARLLLRAGARGKEQPGNDDQASKPEKRHYAGLLRCCRKSLHCWRVSRRISG